MDNGFLSGGLVPLWILGAPILLAIWGLMATPSARAAQRGGGAAWPQAGMREGAGSVMRGEPYRDKRSEPARDMRSEADRDMRSEPARDMRNEPVRGMRNEPAREVNRESRGEGGVRGSGLHSSSAPDNLIENPLDKPGASDNLITNPLDKPGARDNLITNPLDKPGASDNLITNPLDKAALKQAAPSAMFASAYKLLKEAFSSWLDDYAPSMGAALAYYTLFSIAPLLLIVISIAGLVFGQEAARGEIMGQIAGLIGVEPAKAVESLLASLNKPEAGALGTIVGIVMLVIGATSVFAELQDAMNRIWRAPSAPTPNGLWALLRARLLSAGMILGLGFLLMVSLIVSASLAALGKWWEPYVGEGFLKVADLLNFSVSLGLLSVIFAMIYKWMPRVKVAWRDVWIGASLTALLFTLGKALIGLYIGRSGVASGFGAAASLVALLVWVYWSAQIFLLGAEFTWVYAHRRGSLRGRPFPPPQAPDREVPLRSSQPAAGGARPLKSAQQERSLS